MKLILTLLSLPAARFLAAASPYPHGPLDGRADSASNDAAAIVRATQTAINATVVRMDNAFKNGNYSGILAEIKTITSLNSRPSVVQNVTAELQALNGTNVTTLYDYIANLRALNLVDSIDTLLQYANGSLNSGQNSMQNVNRNPPSPVYPSKSSADAPYSVPESSLRGAIYIPANFTYGRVPPVILFPGTGSTGYTAFSGNFIPLLQGSSFADPVWVNVPGYLLGDAQVNAEYAAYAMNYIAAVTGTNVTILAWSQGNIDVQWAHKFWPSTRCVTSDHIAISPDYAGTVLANFATAPGFPFPPSIYQQRYLQSSQFITTLRNFNGDSAYVPTTNIYSGVFDEIVEPQQGTGASAYQNDARGVGVTNYEVQLVCPGQPAGSFYTHESMLVSPLSLALLQDAMTHSGPGNVGRLNLPTVCSTYLAPGLNIGDLFITENSIAIAGLSILVYPSKVTTEPAIKSYATSAPVASFNCKASS